MRRRDFLASTAAVVAVPVSKLIAEALDAERHFLYIVEPGIRNYVSYGGVGILVYDIDQGYKFVRRIPTWAVAAGQEPDNVKGVAASAKTGQIYVTTTKRLAAFDLATDKMAWDVAPEGGCDRPSVSPDGSILYVPSLEGPHWNVVDTKTGATIKKIVLNSRAHNTLFSLDGAEVYLAGLASTTLSIADPKTHTVSRGVGPFAAAIYMKIPVVPVVCRGTAAIMPKGGYLSILPGDCDVFVEPPIPTADLTYDDRTDLRDRVRSIIAARLAEREDGEPNPPGPA